MAFYGPQDEYEPEYCCHLCEEKEKSINNAATNLANLLKYLYNKDSFDSEKFEENLEDLCNTLQMNLPKDELKIIGK